MCDARAAAEWAQIYSVEDPMTEHGISVLNRFVPANALRLTHTSTQNKSMALLIFYWVTFVSNYHEGGAERPLANLSAVNYGNLPSCLSASAAGLPFVSKSKAPICNIGTSPSYKGTARTCAWWRVTFTTGGASDRRRKMLHTHQHEPSQQHGSGVQSQSQSRAERGQVCANSGPGVHCAWVTKGGDHKKYKNTQTQHLCFSGLCQNYGVFGWILSLSGMRLQRTGGKQTSWLYECLCYFIYSIYANVATFTV